LLYPFSLARSRRGWLVDWRIATIPVAALGMVSGQEFLARPQLDLSTAGPALLAPLAVLLAFLGSLVFRPARDRLTPMDVLTRPRRGRYSGVAHRALQQLVQRAARPTSTDLVLGTVMFVRVLEATRRSVGWVLPATAVALVLYGRWGPWLEYVGLSIFAHRSSELNRQIGPMSMTVEGIFSVPLDVAATDIILFPIYGAVLELSRAGKFFIDWALAAMGRSSSGAGPGRTVAVAGFLLGTVSSSGVATTVALGSLAWPLLRRPNSSPTTAGATLAAGGIGAILSPPTLGTAAYPIAEFLKVSTCS
jgi:TRAP-type uncharacterized transport system fused permease subunit